MKGRLTLIAGFAGVLLGSSYLVLYFSLNSNAARAYIQRAMDSGIRKGAIQFRGHRWGPNPRRLQVLGVTIAQADNEKIIDAPVVQTRVDLRELASGHFHLDQIVIRDFYLLLEWTTDHFRFVDAFKSGRPPSKVKKKSRLDLDFRGIQLRNGIVELKFPGWRLNFRQVHISGEFALSDRLHIDARIHRAAGDAHLPQLVAILNTKQLSAQWRARLADPQGFKLPFAGLQLDRFLWKDDGFKVDNLRLTTDASRLQVSGGMGFDQSLSMDYRLLAQFSGDDHLARTLSRGQVTGDVALDLAVEAKLPSPLNLSNLIRAALTAKKSPVTLTVHRLSGANVSLAGVPFTDLSLSLATRLKLGAIDSRLLIEKVILSAREGNVTGQADFQLGPTLFGKNTYRVSALVRKLQLNHIIAHLRRWPKARELAPLAGLVSGSVKLAGELRNVLIPNAPKRIDSDITVRQQTRTLRIRNWTNQRPVANQLTIDWSQGWIRWHSYQAALAVVSR